MRTHGMMFTNGIFIQFTFATQQPKRSFVFNICPLIVYIFFFFFFVEEIFECEHTFERIFLGAIFGPNAPFFIAGWRSDFSDQVLKKYDKTFIFLFKMCLPSQYYFHSHFKFG